MTKTTATAFAVMRRDDATARAIFTDHTDASAYAASLNDKVPFADAFEEGGHRHLWAAYPWTVPADLFRTDDADDTPEEVVAEINATLARRF